MKQVVSAFVANMALAIGVTLVVAIAVGFTWADWNRPPAPSSARVAASGRGHGANTFYLPIPARPALPPAVANQPSSGPINDLPPQTAQRQAPAGSPSALPSLATPEPFEPPPPITAGEAPARQPPEQVASLSGAAPPPDPTTSAPPSANGMPLPALRHTALDTSALDQIPSHLPAAPSGTAGGAPYPSSVSLGGPGIRGHATVTAALELNVAGRMLRLYGLAPPRAGEMCGQGAPFAPRSCAEVSRQALARYLANNTQVTCRVFAAGGGAAAAVCADRDGHDLGAYLVSRGLALAEANGIVDYSAAQQQARAARAGLWQYR
jgi:endonuclease YncB( thermonuclease family)